MRKGASKKSARKSSRSDERPLEFERGWHELEARHDRIRVDMMSLAAQLGISGRMR